MTDLCKSCAHSNWHTYPVLKEDYVRHWQEIRKGYRDIKPYMILAFKCAKRCMLTFKGVRKDVTECKRYLHETEQQRLTAIRHVSKVHRKSYEECIKETMVKMEDVTEYVAPTMLKTHGNIVILLPNEEDEGCGYRRSAKDTPFGRSTTEFFVAFKKDKFKRKYTMNKTTFKKCVEEWGDDSDTWANHELKLKVLAMVVRGDEKQVIFGEPLPFKA